MGLGGSDRSRGPGMILRGIALLHQLQHTPPLLVQPGHASACAVPASRWLVGRILFSAHRAVYCISRPTVIHTAPPHRYTWIHRPSDVWHTDCRRPSRSGPERLSRNKPCRTLTAAASGRDSLLWRLEALDEPPDVQPDPSLLFRAQSQLAAGRTISLQSLASHGAILLGRLCDVSGEIFGFCGRP
jgi:hypothetical protein